MQAIPIPRRRTTHDATSTSPHPSPPYRNLTDPAATTAANRRHLDTATPALPLPRAHPPRHHYNPRHPTRHTRPHLPPAPRVRSCYSRCPSTSPPPPSPCSKRTTPAPTLPRSPSLLLYSSCMYFY